jgi:hypothetical protein
MLIIILKVKSFLITLKIPEFHILNNIESSIIILLFVTLLINIINIMGLYLPKPETTKHTKVGT